MECLKELSFITELLNNKKSEKEVIVVAIVKCGKVRGDESPEAPEAVTVPEEDREEWISMKDACNLLKVDRSTVYRYARDGKIRDLRREGKKYFGRKSILKFLGK